MPAFYIVPGVYPRELDLAHQAKPLSTSIGGAIIVSRKGPEEDRFVTRTETFDELYGKPDASWSFAHYCARAFLRKGQGAWFRRISRNGRHAGSIVYNDREGQLGTKTFFKSFTSGRFENYLRGSQQLVNLVFAGPLVTGNTVTISFTDDNDPATEITVTQAFLSNNDNTLAALAAGITLQINNAYLLAGRNGGAAWVTKVGATVNDDRMISIVSPEDTTLTITDVDVTGGDTQTTATLYEDSVLMEIYAENRGRWANDVGYRLLNVDNGINQRIAITFSAPMTADHAFNARFQLHDSVTNAVTEHVVGPIAFDTNMLTTANAIVGAIQQELGIRSDAWVAEETAGQQIIVVSPSDGPNTLTVPNIEISGGSVGSRPSITVTEVLAGIDKDQTFDIWVYTRDNINEPVEKHTVSFVQQKDGNGNQIFIDDWINKNSTYRSDYIRVKYNENNAAGAIHIPAEGTGINWLNGGDDGVLPTTGDIVLAWDNFKSRMKRPMRILINCGYTAVAVQQKMNNLARARFDCIAVLDMPADKQATQAAIDHRVSTMNLNSSYAALYSPDIYILDELNSKNLFVPPSGHVAAQYAETDEVAAEWFAPAGLNRAILDTCLGVREEYDEDMMAMLISNQINPIINRGGDFVIWDQRTTVRKASPFSNVSLRRMLITIEVSIVDGLDYMVHEPNDDFTAMQIVQICVSILQPIKEGRGLYDYAVVSDDRNNKPHHYDMQQRNVDVLLDPILPIRTIQLTAIVTRKGAAFNEIVAALGGQVNSNLLAA